MLTHTRIRSNPLRNRLTAATVKPTPFSKTFSYGAIGNMLRKPDVGAYVYPAAGRMSVTGT